MKHRIVATLIAVQFFNTAYSQKNNDKSPSSIQENAFTHVSMSLGNNQKMLALSLGSFYGLGKKKKFKVGLGLRYSGFVGKNLNYLTAPAKLTSGATGPQVLFSEIDPNNYDTFFMPKSRVNAINLSINLQYALNSKLDVGFNIDAIGFSFGGSKNGIFSSSLLPSTIAVKAKPTSFNALLISDNDIGTLNSELYVKYWLKENMGIVGGLSFVFTEYTTENKLTFNNDRFRNKALMFMLGFSYKPFK